MLNFGWTLEEYDNADHFELLEVLNAKEEKDRKVDPMTLVKGGN